MRRHLIRLLATAALAVAIGGCSTSNTPAGDATTQPAPQSSYEPVHALEKNKRAPIVLSALAIRAENVNVAYKLSCFLDDDYDTAGYQAGIATVSPSELLAIGFIACPEERWPELPHAVEVALRLEEGAVAGRYQMVEAALTEAGYTVPTLG